MQKARLYIKEKAGDIEIWIERDNRLQLYSSYAIKPFTNRDGIGVSVRMLDTIKDLIGKGFEFGGIETLDKD